MNAAAPTLSEETLVAQYLTQLAQLSPDARLELAARLLQTLKSGAPTGEPTPATTAPLPAFVGAWADDPEADKMEEAIRTSRYFTAKPELEQWS